MGVWVDLIDRKLTFDSKILDHFFYKSCPSRPKLSGTLVHEKIQLTQFLNMASDILDPFLNKTFTWIPEPFIRPVRWWSRNLCLKAVFLFHTTIISSLMNIFLKSQVNGSTSNFEVQRALYFKTNTARGRVRLLQTLLKALSSK